MNTAKLIKEHHEMMIEKGFYDCPECKGKMITTSGHDCYNCKKDPGIDPNKNIGELLALIVGELCGEALEAHRCGRFADFSDYSVSELNMDLLLEGLENKDFGAIAAFENTVKDTFEDELADVFLRLFDFCGYLAKPEEFHHIIKCYEKYDREMCLDTDNIGQWMFDFSRVCLNNIMVDYEKGIMFVPHAGIALAELDEFCKDHNIPIEKFINAKMEYNKTRPYKHGKDY